MTKTSTKKESPFLNRLRDIIRTKLYSIHTEKSYVDVEAYQYRFSEPEVRQNTGRWWQREALGPFRPLPWVERN